MNDLYIVEENTLSGWDNTWGEDGFFTSRDDAWAEVLWHVKACLEGVRDGYLQDAPNETDFRIRRVD
jgi:hypothetical protein